jgi:hypothetical protein
MEDDFPCATDFCEEYVHFSQALLDTPPTCIIGKFLIRSACKFHWNEPHVLTLTFQFFYSRNRMDNRPPECGEHDECYVSRHRPWHHIWESSVRNGTSCCINGTFANIPLCIL